MPRLRRQTSVCRYFFSSMRIVVPVFQDLAKPTGWQRLDERDFVVCRFHFDLIEQQPGEPQPGPAIKTYDSITPYEDEIVVEESFSSVHLVQIGEQLIRGLELSTVAKESVSTSTEASIYALKSKLLSSIEAATSQMASVQSSSTIQTSLSRSLTRTERSTQRYHIPGGRPCQLGYLYRRRAVRVYLSWVDYLQVHYTKRRFALRNRKRVSPAPSGSRPTNVVKTQLPLADICWWEQTPGHVLKDTTDYVVVANSPHRAWIDTPKVKTTEYLAPISEPSLYKLARAAFPRRWVDSNCSGLSGEPLLAHLESLDDREWTDAYNGLWWRLHGPATMRDHVRDILSTLHQRLGVDSAGEYDLFVRRPTSLKFRPIVRLTVPNIGKADRIARDSVRFGLGLEGRAASTMQPIHIGDFDSEGGVEHLLQRYDLHITEVERSALLQQKSVLCLPIAGIKESEEVRAIVRCSYKDPTMLSPDLIAEAEGTTCRELAQILSASGALRGFPY